MEEAAGSRVFRCSPRYYVVLAGVALLVLGALTAVVFWGARVVPPQMKDPLLRILAFYLPLLLALAGLAVLVSLGRANLGKQIRLDSKGIHCGKGWSSLWDNVRFVRPQRTRHPFRTATIIGVEGAIRIDKFFFPNFDELLDQVELGMNETLMGRAPKFGQAPAQPKAEARAQAKAQTRARAQAGPKPGEKATPGQLRSRLEKAMLSGVGAVFQRDHLKGTSYFSQALRALSEDGESPYEPALKLVRQVACEERGAATPMDIERNTASLLIICFSQCPPARRKSISMEAAILASTLWIYEFLRRHCDQKDFGHFLPEIHVRAEEVYKSARARLETEEQLKEAGILPLKA